MFKKKVRVTLIDRDWKPLHTIELLVVPRDKELIYLNGAKKYYQVIHPPIHNYHTSKQQNILIVVEEYTQNKLNK
jgi:hypothetical protein